MSSFRQRPRYRHWWLGCLLWLSCTAFAAPAEESTGNQRSGSDIYAQFREGLAQPHCDADAAAGYRRQFAKTPQAMADGKRDVMPLFGYVVDALREASLPTEFALIPFVESGYRPGARSESGPAGLWQMIGITARNHGVPIRNDFDGRMSPVESTRAAVRYLKTLHGMFAGDWRLAAMAYNAGEYRILAALKNSGERARDVDLDKLRGVPEIARGYVRKLHALACVLDEADDRSQWRDAIDRPVPVLTDLTVPAGNHLDAWASRNGLDVEALRRMNPAFGSNRLAVDRKVLAPDPNEANNDRFMTGWREPAAVETLAEVPTSSKPTQAMTAVAHLKAAPSSRSHTVRRGDTINAIARRYGVTGSQLLKRNGLNARSLLHPGMTLAIE